MNRPTLAQLVGIHMAGLDQLVGADAAAAMVPANASPVMSAFTPATFGVRTAGYGDPSVVPLASRGARGFPIGFGPTSVTAGATVTFTAQPQLIFRPSRLIVPAIIAGSFSIADLKIGKNSQLVSANPIPAVAFAENAVDAGLRLDTCNVGQLIALQVTNNAAGAVVFSAALLGVSIDG